jgi:hypothetical protein
MVTVVASILSGLVALFRINRHVRLQSVSRASMDCGAMDLILQRSLAEFA